MSACVEPHPECGCVHDLSRQSCLRRVWKSFSIRFKWLFLEHIYVWVYTTQRTLLFSREKI